MNRESNATTYDCYIADAILVTNTEQRQVDIGIKNNKIVAIHTPRSISTISASHVISAKGLHVLPGVIDTQVHFRDPGLTHKEDLVTGSLAAVMGGVTSVFEMPNTSPPTTTVELLQDKIERATHNMHCDFAFYAGATADNTHLFKTFESMIGCVGMKIFVGSSTGTLLVDNKEHLTQIIKHLNKRAAFHCEDESRLNARKNLQEKGNPFSHTIWRDEETAYLATQRVLEIARTYDKKVHILHVSTGQEIPLLKQYRDVASVEMTPQHLTLRAEEAYQKIGTFAQMNPPLRDATHQKILWQAIKDNLTDIIGSDHAPHTKIEKQQPYPSSPSGMPGVQTLVPVMLNHVAQKNLSLERFVQLTSTNIHALFKLAHKGKAEIGFDADFTVVDLKQKTYLNDAGMYSRCGWTPFHGMTCQGKVIGTIIRGKQIMWEDTLLTPNQGLPILFK